jgi:ABC-2 type transport system ATP-binding protein
MPATAGPAIAVEGLRVDRGGVEVLHGVTFDVPTSQTVGLLGPSGGGKSTLIRAIVGVQQHVTGRCEVLGRPAGDAALRRRVGYVTQATAVYPDLTVRENLRYFAAILGASRQRVDAVIEHVDLGRVSDHLAGALSGGQLHRVSLAASLLGEPEVLVLDEPTVGLDPVLRRSLWALFAELAAQGVTLLVSSHVMDEARSCDRLLLLRDGALLADGTEADLLARTGTADIDAAFLALIDHADDGGSDGPRPDAPPGAMP